MDKNPLIAKLNKAVPDSVLESRNFGRSGIMSIWLEAESIAKVAAFLKSLVDYEMDWLENLSLVEFEEVLVASYFVTSSKTRKNLILRISAVPKSPLDRVYFPSTSEVWPMIKPMEREAEELFGVCFSDSSEQPGLENRSNFLPENWVGFPLRKGYVFPTEVYGLPHSRSRAKELNKKTGSHED